MRRLTNTLGKMLLAKLLAISLMLALDASEGHSHTADIGDPHEHVATDQDSHPEEHPVSDHAGCHATVFCAGAVFASAGPPISQVFGESGTHHSIRDIFLSSAAPSFDPPPPRLS